MKVVLLFSISFAETFFLKFFDSLTNLLTLILKKNTLIIFKICGFDENKFSKI